MTKLVPEKLKRKLIYILDGRKEDDVFETHYCANSQKQIIALAHATGFEVARIRMTVSDAVFALIPPVAVPELIYLRLLMTKPFKNWRTNIITVLKKERNGAVSV